MSEEKELGPSEAGKAHDRLADAIRIAMNTQCALSVEGGCPDCTERYSATLELAENYARAVAAELLDEGDEEPFADVATQGLHAPRADREVDEWRERSGIDQP